MVRAYRAIGNFLGADIWPVVQSSDPTWWKILGWVIIVLLFAFFLIGLPLLGYLELSR